MANISNSTNDTVITGTASGDSITNTGQPVTINAGDGNNTITSDHRNSKHASDNDATLSNRVYITSGSGKDSVYVNASRMNGFLDSALIYTPYSGYINVGGGDDTIRNYQVNNSEMLGGDGNDDIRISDAINSTIYGDTGNDYIENAGSYDTTIYGGDDNDTVYAHNIDGFNDAGTKLIHHVHIYGGAGRDSIVTNSVNCAVVYGGEDDDYILGTGELNGGAGNDTISINRDAATIVGGAGNDLISLTGSRHLLKYGTNHGKDTVYGYNNSDSLQIAGGYSTAVSGNNVIISVGSGSITLVNAKNFRINIATVEGGADTTPADGDDTLGVEFNAKKPTTITITDSFTGTVDAAKFSDKVTSIDASKATQPVMLKAGSKSTVLRAGSGGSTLLGGKADDKLYGGSGVDLFAYTLGNGKDVLNSVEAQDIVSIDGASLDQFTFKDSKAAVTIDLGDKNSKLTVNKTNANNTITFDIDGEEFVYGSIPGGASLNSAKTTLTLSSEVADGTTINANVIASTIKELDASKSNGSIELLGNANANVLRASKDGSTMDGGLGNDKLYGGSGSDVFVYSIGGGADVVYNFDGRQGDYVVLEGVTSLDSKTVKVSATKVDVTVGKGKLSFDNPNGEMKFFDASGNQIYTTGVNLTSGVGYNKNKTAITIDSSAADVGTIDLNEPKYFSTVKEIDASLYGGAIEMIGNAQANIFRAGSGSSTMNGGLGNDKLYGGSDADVFKYSVGGGNDVIYGFDGTKGDYVILEGIDKLDSSAFKASATKVEVKIGTGKLTFDNPNGEIKFVDSTGKELYSMGVNFPSGVGYNKNKTAITIDGSAADVGTIDLGTPKYLSAVKEVDASLYGGAIHLIGNEQKNVLKAGTGNSTLDGSYNSTTKKSTADKLYGGNGSDTFVWNTSLGGADQFFNYDYAQGDIISITGGTAISKANFKENGKNVVLTVGSNKLTINDVKDKAIVAVQGNDTITFGSLPSGVSYNDLSKKTALNISDPYTGTIDAADYAASIVTLNAAAATGELVLIGSKKAKFMVGGAGKTTMLGSTTADVFTGGTGSDTFVYSVGGGKDQIVNFDTGTDVIKLDGISIANTAFSEKGNDVLLAVKNGSITIKNAPRQATIAVENGDGTSISYKTLPSNVTYKSGKITIAKDFDGTLDVAELGGLTVKEINASAATKSIELRADSNATKITAGKGGSTMLGGGGNDTLIGGKGVDIFRSSGGNDVITNYTDKQDKIQIEGALESGKLSGTKDVELTTAGGKLLVKGVVGKELTLVVDGSDRKYIFTKQNSDLESARIESGSQLPSDEYWFEQDSAIDDPIDEIMTIDCAVNLQSEFEFFNQSPDMKLAIKSSLELNRRRK